MSDATFSEDTHIGDTNVPWSAVRAAASEVLLNSWSPYSNFRVGAAALLQDGRIGAGTNIENASYGLTFCGEISMIGANVSGGRCRHVMAEHSDENTKILSSVGPKKLIGDVLPYYGSF